MSTSARIVNGPGKIEIEESIQSFAKRKDGVSVAESGCKSIELTLDGGKRLSFIVMNCDKDGRLLLHPLNKDFIKKEPGKIYKVVASYDAETKTGELQVFRATLSFSSKK